MRFKSDIRSMINYLQSNHNNINVNTNIFTDKFIDKLLKKLKDKKKQREYNKKYCKKYNITIKGIFNYNLFLFNNK